MKKRILCMLLAGIMVMSMSMSVLAADKNDEGIEPHLFNNPVYTTTGDADGNTYTAIGECYEGGPGMSIVGARTICEVYDCKDKSASGKAAVRNKDKTVKVEGASLITLSGTMPIPSVSKTAKGDHVSIYTEINNAPYIKVSLGAEHKIIIGSSKWSGVSTCTLL
jgi:hypothetical protein